MKTQIQAAKQFDWQQVVLNGGPPCFYIEEDGRFCGRAHRWEGHGLKDFHDFVSLEKLLLATYKAGMTEAARICESKPPFEGTFAEAAFEIRQQLAREAKTP